MVVIFKETEIKTRDLTFIITECPNESQMNLFNNILERNSVKYIIRINKDCYSKELIKDQSIIIKDFYFTDGDYPPNEIIQEYNLFIKEITLKHKFKPVILIHCVASLGRSPTIIALQLINENQLSRMYIVEYIRSKRHGALNSKQLHWILDYRPIEIKESKVDKLKKFWEKFIKK